MINTNYWRLSMDKSESYRLQANPVTKPPPQTDPPTLSSPHPTICEIYLQELNQIPTVNTGEKSLPASGRGEKKEPF